MMNRTKFFAALLPIAAIGFLAAENTAGTGHAGEPVVLAQATTLDAAPRGRGAIRGARPTPEPTGDVEQSRAGDTVDPAGHPRRQGAEPLPRSDHGWQAYKTRSGGPRGARG